MVDFQCESNRFDIIRRYREMRDQLVITNFEMESVLRSQQLQVESKFEEFEAGGGTCTISSMSEGCGPTEFMCCNTRG